MKQIKLTFPNGKTSIVPASNKEFYESTNKQLAEKDRVLIEAYEEAESVSDELVELVPASVLIEVRSKLESEIAEHNATKAKLEKEKAAHEKTKKEKSV